MKISKLKSILRELKQIVKYNDSNTLIEMCNQMFDPYIPPENEYLRIRTKINDVEVVLTKYPNKKGENSNGRK